LKLIAQTAEQPQRTPIAKLSTDEQVLDHVRELIRFFKGA